MSKVNFFIGNFRVICINILKEFIRFLSEKQESIEKGFYKPNFESVHSIPGLISPLDERCCFLVGTTFLTTSTSIITVLNSLIWIVTQYSEMQIQQTTAIRAASDRLGPTRTTLKSRKLFLGNCKGVVFINKT